MESQEPSQWENIKPDSFNSERSVREPENESSEYLEERCKTKEMLVKLVKQTVSILRIGILPHYFIRSIDLFILLKSQTKPKDILRIMDRLKKLIN